MGIGDLWKGVFSPKHPSIDYSHLPTEELERLSADRTPLTDAAREALIAELERRGLSKLEVPAPIPEQRAIEKECAPIEGDPIIVLERRGILLRTQANAAVMLLLPLWNAEPIGIERRDVRANVTELIVFNHDDHGFLPAAFIADKLTVPRKQIFVLDEDRVADRPMPGVPSPMAIVGVPLADEVDIGWLHLERSEHAGVVIATWDNGEIDLCIAIGPSVPMAIFREYEGITHVIGGIAPPSPADLDVITDPKLYEDLATVILVLDCAGASAWPIGVLPVEISSVGRESSSEGHLIVDTKRAIDAGAWERVEALLEELSAREIEDLVDGLLLERNQSAAGRVLDLALASDDWKDTGRIHFLRGVVHFMAGDVDRAVDVYERATLGDEPDPRAFANLSAVHRRSSRHDAAIRAADRGVAAMPDDAISRINLAASFASAGRLDDARKTIDEGESILGASIAEEWRARLSTPQPLIAGPDEFPHLSRKAYQVGCHLASLGRIDAAIDMMKRCLELEPSNLEALVELGTILSSAGREEEALAHYDRAVNGIPGLPFLRFNRANCLVRLGRVAEAIPELRRIIQDVPAWDAPYVNLASILIERGERAEARHIVESMAQAAPGSEHLVHLEERLA